MMKSNVPCLVDAVEVGDVQILLLGPKETVIPGMTMNAKYALTISETGVRVGAGTKVMWSGETHEKLRALLASMERDIIIEVFGEAPPIDGGEKQDDHNPDGVQGL